MNVVFSLASYMLVYLIIFPTGVFLMARIVRKGPSEATSTTAPIEGGQHRSPIDTLPEQTS
jgi:cytochrome d ubiquinol oxidase subunit I